ncbi:MAG: acetyl-CoA carboxylase carboxyltransferase subunit beta [Bacilli bacterium]|nr:acetyl-CoA carboxylase carboxyltransferase subunit beta [Bacilli bacterium]
MANFLDKHREKVVMFNQQYRGKRKLKTTKIDVPENLFTRCPFCQDLILTEAVEANDYVCPYCGKYFQISGRKRLAMLVDPGSFIEYDKKLKTSNPLNFPGYEEKIHKVSLETGENEAFISGKATIDRMNVMIGVLDSHFLMGSMGSVVGEKVTRLIEASITERLPLVIVCASGGARMQEGIFSLMQMAKTAAALARHNDARLFYLSVITHPTTGGVSASFAMLGDIIVAEKDALIGFAGKRVIAQTIKEDLPDHFQTADFLLEKGMLDIVIERKELKQTIVKLLQFHRQEEDHDR